MDKNYIYRYQLMACGGSIFVDRSIDRNTFRIFEGHPHIAGDKNTIYAVGYMLEDADPETFRVVYDKEYLISRDKNHFYWNWGRMSDEEVRAMEQELRIELFTQTDCMNFTAEKFDSVTITFGEDHNKELSSPLDGVERDTFIVRGDAQLSKPEIEELHQWFRSEKTLTDTVPLLSHGDIIITYYQNDTIAVVCHISSQTRKFTLLNGERYFARSITPAFEKYLTALIRKKKLWSDKESFFDWD
jgi:hypothetical protein